MQDVSVETIGCPYCGETISVLLDPSVPTQEYIEDCQVCCRPIVLTVCFDTEGEAMVSAKSENE